MPESDGSSSSSSPHRPVVSTCPHHSARCLRVSVSGGLVRLLRLGSGDQCRWSESWVSRPETVHLVYTENIYYLQMFRIWIFICSFCYVRSIVACIYSHLSTTLHPRLPQSALLQDKWSCINWAQSRMLSIGEYTCRFRRMANCSKAW